MCEGKLGASARFRVILAERGGGVIVRFENCQRSFFTTVVVWFGVLEGLHANSNVFTWFQLVWANIGSDDVRNCPRSFKWRFYLRFHRRTAEL